jgi:hypothetical protein
MKRSLWCASAALAVAGFAPTFAFALSDDEPLSMTYEDAPEPAARPGPTAALAVAPTLRQSCTLRIGKVDEQRSNPANVGHTAFMLQGANSTPLGMASLKGGDGLAWTRAALRSLGKQGFQVVDAAQGAAPGPRDLSADAGLRLAHTWSAGLNLVSHVVVNLTYHTAGGDVSRQYHGTASKTNWANGNGEFMSTLNLAMNQIVRNIAADAATLCDGKALAIAAGE